MSCGTGVVLGSSGCEKDYGNPLLFGISSERITYTGYGQAQTSEKVRVLVQEDRTYWISQPIQGTENTAPEEVTEEDAYGRPKFAHNTPGSTIVYLANNPCDFTGLTNTYNGGSYYVEPYFDDSTKLLLKKQDGTYEALRAQVNAIPVGVAGFDGKAQQYRLSIKWANVDQWDQVALVKLVDDLIVYSELMPGGWDSDYVTAYTAMEIDIKLWDRCDRDSLATDNPVARVVTSNVVDAAVSAGALTDGVSTLTITKASTPETLVAGDFITYVLEYLDGSAVEKSTEALTFTV